MTSPLASARTRRLSVFGILAMAVAAVGMFVAGLVMAPAATAAGGEGKIETYSAGNVTWDLGGRISQHTTAKKQTTPPPTKGRPKAPTQSKAPAPTVMDSATLWFYQKGVACVSADEDGGGELCYSWPAGLTEGECTMHPSADPNYGYDGNGIPLPKPGETAQSRAVSWTVNLTRTKIEDITPYEDLVDPKDPTKGWVVIGEGVETSYLYDYQWKCNYATAPALSRAYCATWVKAQLNGPYEPDKAVARKPMKSILQGGTNTRTPYGDGVFGTEGKPFEEPSKMGENMQKSGLDPKTDAPTVKIMQADCIPVNNDDFDKVKQEESSTLGRYEIPQTTWYVKGQYYWFEKAESSDNIPNIYPGSVKSPNFKNNYQIYDISKPYPTNLTTYAKLICLDGTISSGLIGKLYVGQGTKKDWNTVGWDDYAPEYYSWNCGPNPGAPGEVRQKDFLQCDRYGNASSGGFPNIIVDNKYAAPITNVAQMVDGKAVPVESRDGIWRIGSAADPIGVEWQRVRINTRDGRDVNDSGRNVTWQFQYRLAPWSSPKLKNADVNAVNQPYHGWVDTTNNLTPSGVPGDRKWEPDVNYSYQTAAYTYKYEKPTYHDESDPKPYTYHDEQRPRQETYQCGTETYQCGTESYKCNSHCEYTRHTGGASCQSSQMGICTRWVCPAGWNLDGQTCWIDACDRWVDDYCERPRYCDRPRYCERTVYDTISVKDAPPAGCVDNGQMYVCQKPVMDEKAAPWEWLPDVSQWRLKNPPPVGWHDDGSQYVSDDPLNDGYLGGISFDNWRKWPTYEGLKDCEVNPSDYNANQRDKTYYIKCGDNVTDRTRSAYFRYFMSTTAGAAGWQVTPWWRVTADIQTDYTSVNQIAPSADGDSEIDSSDMNGKWLRQTYECPGQPFTVNIERVAK